MSVFRYEALEVFLRQQIQTGRYKVGEKLPSVRTLCQQHDVMIWDALVKHCRHAVS